MKWEKKGHQFDAIGKIFEQRNRILIYGAGQKGVIAYEQLKHLKCVDGFIDQDKEKQLNGWFGLPVYPVDRIMNARDDEHLIITAVRPENKIWLDEINSKLLSAGYVKGVDFIDFNDFFTDPVRSDFMFQLYAVYARNLIFLSSACIIPSTVCNLNCEKCLNFTPALNVNRRHLVKPIAHVLREIDLLFKWVDYTPRYQISGGEPLLYPHFCEVVEYIGQNYCTKIGDRFETVLNGSVVPTEEQCRVLKKYNVLVIVDDYTEHVQACRENRPKIIEMMNRYGIRMEDNFVQNWFDLEVDKTDNTAMSEGELTEYFDRCGNPWNCHDDGKLYSCNFSQFAVKAGIIPATDYDSFDLTVEPTPERKRELFEFVLGYNRKGYAELCKRCAGWVSVNKRMIPVAIQSKKK